MQEDPKVLANVAKMRQQGATPAEVQQYLDYEHGAPATPASATSDAPGAPAESTMKGFGRSMLQHGLMNFGDELGVVDPAKQAAFEKNHKILNFLATIGGGAAAPLAATLAAPELAGAGGAVALGGLAGMISGAGDQNGAGRADNALHGAAGGILGGAAGNLAGAAAGAAGPAVVKGAMHEAVSPEALAHAAFLGPHGYGAKVAGAGARAGAKAITAAIKKAVLNKAPAEKAANLFELTQQFGGGTTSLFGAPAAAAASQPMAGAVGGALGAQAGAAAPSMFHAPDQQY